MSRSFPSPPAAYILHAHLPNGTDWTGMATEPGRITAELSTCPPCTGVTVHEWHLHTAARGHIQEWRKHSMWEWKL
jgi:hypothetical protein